MSDSDMIETEVGTLLIPGWQSLLAENKNRALTLQAMINLELKHHLYGDKAPTQMAILQESIRLGATLSPTSQKATNAHIKKLIELDHVVPREDYDSPERGRGGPTSPWRTRYVSSLISRAIKESLAKKDDGKD